MLALALLLPSAAPGQARVQARERGALVLPGLSEPARVITDRFGIPHVRAASLSDLYFAWGWVTARDRLWQLVYTRAAGEGRLHRWFGNDELLADGGAQLFELRERAARIWARDRLDPALALAVGRYAEGIDAYLGECRAGREPWPRELAMLGERPADWRPEDCVLVLLGLGVTLDLDLPELREAQSVREHGAAWVTARRRFESRWIYDTMGSSGTSTVVPPTSAAPPAARGVALAARTAREAGRLGSAWRAVDADGAARASNEMVVGPARSASGRPLLANDPHLRLTAPGPFHVVHVSVPGVIDAAGASVPGLPAIVSGRSRRAAWGVTALSADAIDVYADTISADGRRVKGPSGWARVIEKPYALSYRVLGVPLPALGQWRRYTPHGPVLVWDPKHHVALSARWAAMDDSAITLAAFVGIERARTADEIAARVRRLVTPEINVVVADVDGAVRYAAVGHVPERPFAPQPGPLPGDGRHEWSGVVPLDSMPFWRVPAAGFAVNGNNRPCAAPPAGGWQGYDFAQDRAARMAQRLAGDASVTLADLMSVQNDVRSRAAERQLPALLAAVAGADSPPLAREALDSLRGWNLVARRSRVAPTIMRSWWNAYLRRSGFEGVPGLALAALTGEAPGTLRAPGGAAETPAQAARGALAMALDTLRAALGPRLADWTWGRAHRARFSHPLADAGRGRDFEPALQPADGDGSTVSVGGSRAPWSFEFTHGPAFRHVVDLADSTRSWCVVPPWNSAEAAARGSDLRGRWASHAYVPLDLDWRRIADASAVQTELRPLTR
jgi:penicillin amidase